MAHLRCHEGRRTGRPRQQVIGVAQVGRAKVSDLHPSINSEQQVVRLAAGGQSAEQGEHEAQVGASVSSAYTKTVCTLVDVWRC
eukprot:244132-Chlamydomonas_euryale.AAC.9